MDILVLIDRIVYLSLKEEQIRTSSTVPYKKSLLSDMKHSLSSLNEKYNSILSGLNLEALRVFKGKLDNKIESLLSCIDEKSITGSQEGLSINELSNFLEYYKYYQQIFDEKIEQIKSY